MKNILYKILLATILFSSVSAEISQNQVDEYMKVSMGGALLKYLQNKLFYIALDTYKIDINGSKKISRLIKENLNSEEYVTLFTKDIKENLESYEYDEIMTFYKTDIGKKYAHAIEKNFIFHKHKLDIQIHEEFNEFIKQSPFSETKQILIDEIAKELHTFKIGLKLSEEFEYARQKELHLIDKTDNYVIKKRTTKSYNNAKKWDKEVAMIQFKDFTENELNKVLCYASTKVAKKEYLLTAKGDNAYSIKVIHDMILGLKEKSVSYKSRNITERYAD